MHHVAHPSPAAADFRHLVCILRVLHPAPVMPGLNLFLMLKRQHQALRQTSLCHRFLAPTQYLCDFLSRHLFGEKPSSSLFEAHFESAMHAALVELKALMTDAVFGV